MVSSSLENGRFGRRLKRRSSFRWILFPLLLAVIGGCSSRKEEPVTEPDPTVSEIESFTTRHFKGSEPRWKLVGKKAQMLASGGMRVEKPKVLIYQNGKPTLNIQGDYGEVNQQTYDLHLTGNVQGLSRDGILKTNEAFWRDRDGRLHAPGDVEITRGRSVVTGKNMVGFPDLQNVHMVDVRFRTHPKDKRIPEYTLDLLGED